MAVRDYDPGAVTLTWGSIQIQGFAEGSSIQWEPDGPTFTKQGGNQGDYTRVRSRMRGSKFTITLMQTHPVNTILSQALDRDRKGLSQKAPVALKDLNGETLISAEQGWLEGFPSSEFGDSDAGREWVLDCGETEVVIGGSLT